MAELCQRNRQVARDSGLALGRLRARNQKRTRRPVRSRKQNRGTEIPERFDERGVLRFVAINAVPVRVRVFASYISFELERFIPWEEPWDAMLVAILRRHNWTQGTRSKA